MDGVLRLLHDPAFTLTLVLGFALVLSAVRLRRGAAPGGFGREATMPLRAILAVLVVLGHMDNMTGKTIFWLHSTHWATPAVSVFLFLSGYGLLKSLARSEAEGRRDAHWNGFGLKTFSRIVLPVVLLGSVWWAYRFCVGRPLKLDFVDWCHHGRSLFIPHDWFVFAILFCYAEFRFAFARFAFRTSLAVLFAATAAYWCGTRLLWGEAERQWFLTCWSFPVGLLFARFETRIKAVLAARPVVVCLALAVLLVGAFGLMKAGRFPCVGKVREPFYALIGPCTAVVFSVWGGFLARVRPLAYLGVISYEIFLVHGFFQHEFLRLGLPSALYILAVFAATLAVSAPLARLDAFLVQRICRHTKASAVRT